MSDPKKVPEKVVKDPLGHEGVTESPFDLPVDEKSYDEVRENVEPSAVPTPTAPDDERNASRSQTDGMNEHIPQSVPRDY